MNYVSLTALAQQLLAAKIRPDDRVIDATVGNGRDTLFLARQLGAEGRVIGFDVQSAALEAAGNLLRTEHLAADTRLIQAGHEYMVDHLPADWRGAVGAVMFNLGYLPGSNKTITTQAATTLRALSQARGLLRSGGVLSVLVYRGHAGGGDESSAVDQWLKQLPNRFARETHESPGPLLHIIERRT